MNAVEGMQAFVFSLPPLPASIGGLPVQMVITSTGDFVVDLRRDGEDQGRRPQERPVHGHRQRSRLQPADHRGRRSTATRPTTSASRWRRSATRCALLVGENYVNRFNLDGRSYQVIPQVPRLDRLSPETLTQYYVTSATGQQVPLSNLVTVKTTTAPNALTRYNQLNSATFQAVPMPGRHDGPGGRFPRKAGRRAARPGSATTTCRTRGNT